MSEATTTVETPAFVPTPEAMKSKTTRDEIKGLKPRPKPGTKKPAAATAKTSKSNPKAPAKKAATTAKKSGKNEVHENKVAVLKAIKHKDLTIANIMGKTGLTRRAVYHAVYHMREDKMVTEKTYEEDRATFFSITAKGKAVLEK